MATFEKPPRYRTFLLTCWEERGRDPDAPIVWRIRLEDPRTDQRRGFAGVEEMAVFLQTTLMGSDDSQTE